MEVNRQRIVVITGIAVGLVAVVGLGYYFVDYRGDKRLAAYAAAFDKYTATVGTQPAATPGMPTPNKVTYPDDQTKYKESAAAFEQLANDYSTYRDIGHYYAGLSYLHTEPDKGVQMLQALADGSSELKHEARLALAEQFNATGAFDKAEAAYQTLADDPGNLPRFYILNQLAGVKERLGKPAEAAPLYKLVVDADRSSSYGSDAEKGLQRVDPSAAAALPPKSSSNPSYSMRQPGGATVPMQ
jgi:tetratricopeptide (TPR) repeat protein